MHATQTTTLTEFLLARINEDEADARRAIGDKGAFNGAWHYGESGASRWVEDSQPDPGWRGYSSVIVYDEHTQSSYSEPLPHIARHDPARVLAECEAKRRIVERLALVQEGDTTEHAWHEQGLYEALGYLAATYADHPDYQDHWRP